MKTTGALLFLVLICFNAKADHVLGGELYYTHLTNNTYRITMTVFGDCAGGSFSALNNAHPRINVLNERGEYNVLILDEDISQRAEVSNVCPAEAANTTCKTPTGKVPGVTKFVYSATTELLPAERWRFLFAGEMDASGKMQSGFTFQISNVTNNSGFGFYMYLEATLNNLKRPNSSPRFTTIPTPYYCINIPQQYNPGAVDKDGDRLSFELTKPIDLNGIITKYIQPYSPTYPFSTTSGTVDHNRENGQMSFTPSKQEVVLVVQKTEEQHDGYVAGTCMRVMSFFMRNSCSNVAPYGAIDPGSVTGAIQNKNSINTCKEDSVIRFSIPVTDPNQDKISVELTNIPQGANISIQNNGTTSPAIDVYWNVNNTPPGRYTFYAHYEDGACPIPGNQVMAYDINITSPITIEHKALSLTNCKYKQYTELKFTGGLIPRIIEIHDENGLVIASYKDTTGNIVDSFAVGSYFVSAYSEHLSCSTSYSFNVTDSGTYPDPPTVPDKHVCLHDPVAEMQPVPTAGSKVQWYDLDGTRLEYIPTYSTDEVFHFKWLVNQKVKVCESVFDTVHIRVHPLPEVTVLNEGGHACMGDGLFLMAQGAKTYEWQPSDKIELKDDKPYTSITAPATYTVIGYSEYGCTGFDTLTFDQIEQCCTFSYPTAFTPNSDGLNDGWHPITYGNVDFYLLSVYNRWGERIFITSDPQQKWDGTYHGLPADIGTYHFKLKANCIIGRMEENSGSFILMR